MFKKWMWTIFILMIIIILGFSIWRGVPPFQLRTDVFPGLLSETIVNSEKNEVKIYKSQRKLELYSDGQIIGIFKIALGFSPSGDKEIEGDGKTPEGCFSICYINNRTPYLYFYGIDYPNIKDAKRGLEQGLISQEQYQQIIDAIKAGDIPLWKTSLGGEVGIHGGGSLVNWTQGCIAVSDTDILILKDYLKVGTSVEILP